MLPAVIEFIYGPLADNLHRLGKQLRGDFEGLWSARRADYRILYSIEEDQSGVLVVRVGHRAHIYRP